MVHVGEEVTFDFVLQDLQKRRVDPTGIADYCVAMIGNERIEVEPDLYGHFQFSHSFATVRPGERVKVKAVAYQQRGGRDYVKIRDRWMSNDSPYEQADRKMPGDAITLIGYVAPIVLQFPAPPDELDRDTGVLRIRRSDGTSTAVYVDKPGRPGFTLSGPEPDGVYRVEYLPKGNELNPTGTTEAEFTILDVNGRRPEAAATLDTP